MTVQLDTSFWECPCWLVEGETTRKVLAFFSSSFSALGGELPECHFLQPNVLPKLIEMNHWRVYQGIRGQVSKAANAAEAVFLVDVETGGPEMLGPLEPVFQSTGLVKVFHDCREARSFVIWSRPWGSRSLRGRRCWGWFKGTPIGNRPSWLPYLKTPPSAVVEERR